MIQLYRHNHKKAGLPPGTLVHVGEKKMEDVRISRIQYNESELQEIEIPSFDMLGVEFSEHHITWINIDGLHDVPLMEKIKDHFEIHPLIMEDILNTEQRPVYEEMEQGFCLILKMIQWDTETTEIKSEQISLILQKDKVITFQERVGDVFEPIRERLRKSLGRIRKMHTDYLAYSLIDAIVDHYFITLEAIGDEMENLEEEIASSANQTILHSLHEIKKQLMIIRRAVIPLRDIISNLERSDSPYIFKSTKPYLRDLYDHIIQISDRIDIMRDLSASLFDLYLSSIGQKTNEVMKVLTIIATIFIPLTFIAGIYGMNFEWMPELSWKWGYFTVWGIMIILGLWMLYFFQKKRWL